MFEKIKKLFVRQTETQEINNEDIFEEDERVPCFVANFIKDMEKNIDDWGMTAVGFIGLQNNNEFILIFCPYMGKPVIRIGYTSFRIRRDTYTLLIDKYHEMRKIQQDSNDEPLIKKWECS